MTISIVSSLVTNYANDDKNSLTDSIAAATGDIIYIAINYRQVNEANFTVPTWNGQTFERFFDDRKDHRDDWVDYFWLKVSAGGTANLVSLSPGFARVNSTIVVLRSSSSAFLDEPVTFSNYSEFIEGVYTLPYHYVTAASGSFLINTFTSSGFDSVYEDVTATTWTANSPASLVGSAQGSTNYVNRMYSASAELSGNVTSAYTKTASGEPTWSFASFVFSEASATITSINDGNSITVGQSSIPVEYAGFSGAITSITNNRAGLTASVISGDADSTIFSISGWQEGAEYPLLDSDVTFTFSRDGESASGSQAVTKPDGWAQVTFSSPDIIDDRKFGKAIAEAGQTVEGSTLYYDATELPGLVINPDTSGEPLENGGSFDAWLRDVSTGLMHYWRITIAESGDIVDAHGITAREITASQSTARAITARGV